MVAPIRNYGSLGRTAASRRGAGPGFTLPEAEAGQASRPTEAVSSHMPLLGLQLGWSEAERDDAALRRGSAALSELERLHLALLSGRMEASGLARLAALAEGEAGADPRLREIIDGISLRVRVELARLAVSPKGQSREIGSAPCTWRE